ncbi:Glutathione transport system permease protein GsiC [Devosia equisanguinis]|uniref:Glutathione transport system permease protein GsiC n=1 Tax=Devosia equisanguinis TaxID=2490941 RepID=A0A447IC61_9HYPH|nr:ABC transporter permease [Devosia equisanguinis]VDS05053.1 Glutathione transport system permease protein GsiC [Devosia equisanguinis]
MIWSILNRATMAAITLFGVALVVFLLLRLAPGDPIAMMIGPSATAEDIARLRASYGLDESLFNQFWIWLGNLAQGDFGTSISRRIGVGSLLLERLPVTLELAFSALIVALLLGGAIAISGTLWRRNWASGALDGATGLMLAIPEFVWALGLVLLLGVTFPMLPLSGRINPSLSTNFVSGFYLFESILTARFDLAWDLIRHMAMPVLALALPLAAIIARVLREALGEAMMQDYVTLARVKGMNETRLIFSETLRNAIGPTLALAGVQFTFLIGGTVIVEKIFAYPGLGSMAIDAVINRDFPLIQGLVLMFGLIFIIVNLLVDAAIVAFNPRLRHG